MIQLGKLSCQVGNLFYILQRAGGGSERRDRERKSEREESERARNGVLSLCECLEMDFLSADTLGALLTLTSPFCKLTSSYPAKSELAS